jgi:hypothetical protein
LTRAQTLQASEQPGDVGVQRSIVEAQSAGVGLSGSVVESCNQKVDVLNPKVKVGAQ